MPAMPPLRTIANGQPVDATDPEYNFTILEMFVTSELVNRDGTVPMTSPLTLSGLPTSANHAANKAYVDSIFPTGMMIDYGRATLMPGLENTWEVCNGQSVSQTEPKYAALFAVIGTKFGSEGSGLFNLPNFKRKMAVGQDSADVAWETGKSGGSGDSVAAHTHTGPSHSHTITHTHSIAHNHANNFSINAGGNHSHTTNASDGGSVQPVNSSGVLWYPAIQSTVQAGGFEARAFAVFNAAASIAFAGFGMPNLPVHIPQLSMNSPGDHGHGISGGITATSDGSGPSSAPTTGAEGTGVTGPASTAATNGNYPPYVVVTKLIKL